MLTSLFHIFGAFYNKQPTEDPQPMSISEMFPKNSEGGTLFNSISGEGWIGSLIADAINGILFFLWIFTLAAIIGGGYMWVTALGNEEKITKAKKIVGWAITGFIIVIASYAIVNTLTGQQPYIPIITPPSITKPLAF